MSKSLISKSQFTEEQLQLITNTVARGATRDELNLFLYRCKEMKLNPLKPGQIFFIKYGSTATIVVGIEGFRSNAARTGKHVSTKRGVIRNDNGDLIAGTCTVKRRDERGEIQEYTEESPFAEFNNPKNPKWQSMPETMIKKVAEAAALRMAYPDNLGGIYIEEEKDLIERANGKPNESIKIFADQPTADDRSEEGEAIMMARQSNIETYLVPFGSLRGHRLSNIELSKLKNAIFLTENNISIGRVYSGSSVEEMQQFVDLAASYIASIENGVINE